MTELPSVNDVNQASQAPGLGATAAELHGGLCGWLAAGGAPGNDWPARVLADDALQPVAEGSALARETSSMEGSSVICRLVCDGGDPRSPACVADGLV